ncbi:MAG: type II toxin-antitoxin system VapC family toxin [Candidatus Korobacteraceae bacterium]
MIILDTNVLSELLRPRPSARIALWVEEQPRNGVFTTSVTEAEIFYGIELLPKGKRREALLAAAEAMFSEDFAGQVISFDSDAARAYSRIAARRRGLGRPIAYPDGQIAAISNLYGAVVATRNVSDFENCGIQLVNPWTEPSPV